MKHLVKLVLFSVFLCQLCADVKGYYARDYLECVERDKFDRLFFHPMPEWMSNQMDKDLGAFKKNGITQEALDATFEYSVDHMRAPWGQKAYTSIHRFRCINGKIYIYKFDLCGTDQLESFLVTFAKLGHLPNLDLIYCSADGVPEEYLPKDFWITPSFDKQAPLLGRAKMSWAQYVVLVPDGQTLLDWIGLAKWILERSPFHLWHKKQARVSWRGAPSDVWINNMDSYPPEAIEAAYKTRPRRILCQLSKDFPSYVDAGFNYVFGNQGIIRATVGLGKEAQTWDAQMDYKYLPVLDGWCCTYPGYLWRLLSESLTMKQQLESKQWFYDALVPYVHYVPIMGHMEDLIEKIDWARAHDRQCQQIAANAREFVLNNLMPEHVYYYYCKVLERYASLQKFDFDELEKQAEGNPDWLRIY